MKTILSYLSTLIHKFMGKKDQVIEPISNEDIQLTASREIKSIDGYLPSELFFYGNAMHFKRSHGDGPDNLFIAYFPEEEFEQWKRCFVDSPFMKAHRQGRKLWIHARALDLHHKHNQDDLMEFNLWDIASIGFCLGIKDVMILEADHMDPRAGFALVLETANNTFKDRYAIRPILNFEHKVVTLEIYESEKAKEIARYKMSCEKTDTDREAFVQEHIRKLIPSAHLELLRLTHANSDDVELPQPKRFWLHLIDTCESKFATPEQAAWYTLYGKQTRIDIAGIGLGVVNEDSFGVFKYRPAFLDGQTFNTRPETQHLMLNWDNFEFVDERKTPEGGYPANMDPVHLDTNPLSVGTKTLEEIQVQPRLNELGNFNFVPELATQLNVTSPDKPGQEVVVLPRVAHIYFPHYFYPITSDQDITETMSSLMQSFFDRDENGHATVKSIIACITLMSEEDYQDLEVKRLSKHDD